MKSNKASLLLAGAAMAGLLSGTAVRAQAHTSSGNSTVSTVNAGVLVDIADSGKHDCKGKNDCKGQGGCKSSDNGCKAKNSCKGKGGCNGQG